MTPEQAKENFPQLRQNIRNAAYGMTTDEINARIEQEMPKAPICHSPIRTAALIFWRECLTAWN